MLRNLYELDQYRRTDRHVMENWGWAGDGGAGMFMIPSPVDRKPIAVVASSGEGWDHVSVSRSNRCPNWPEMEFIANLFFKGDEVAMQLHVPANDHVNNHPYCLHWWRPPRCRDTTAGCDHGRDQGSWHLIAKAGGSNACRCRSACRGEDGSPVYR